MKCIIGHEIQTDRGFKVFEAGIDYPAEETAGRERYFEQGPVMAEIVEEKLPEPEIEKPSRRGRKINEEVES